MHVVKPSSRAIPPREPSPPNPHTARMQSSWFKARMDELGLKQDDLAPVLGVDRSQVSRIINGRQQLKLREVEALADILRVSTLEILRRAHQWKDAEIIALVADWQNQPPATRRRLGRVLRELLRESEDD